MNYDHEIFVLDFFRDPQEFVFTHDSRYIERSAVYPRFKIWCERNYGEVKLGKIKFFELFNASGYLRSEGVFINTRKNRYYVVRGVQFFDCEL